MECVLGFLAVAAVIGAVVYFGCRCSKQCSGCSSESCDKK